MTLQRPGQTQQTRTIGTNASTNRLSVATYHTSGNLEPDHMKAGETFVHAT